MRPIQGMRSCHSLLSFLYGGLLAFLLMTLYIFTFQQSPKKSPCSQGHNTQLCLYEENRRSFEHLVVVQERTLGKKNSAAEADEERQGKQRKVQAEFGQQAGVQSSHEAQFVNPEMLVRDREGVQFDKHTEEREAQATVPKAGSGSGQRSSTFRPLPALYQPVLSNGLNCSKVWQGDTKEVQRATIELNGTQAARRPEGFYQTITRNCQRYREQTGYIQNISQTERKFPLAFSIMVYKDAEQLERLLRAIYRPNNVYCIHPDLKTKPQVLRDMRAIIECLPNVIEAPRRLNVVWGKFSVLEIELICMEALWAMKTKWKYLINLTGQEFPLKTNKELVKILTVYRGANDILGETPKERNLWRWMKAGVPAPHNITIAKGPVHIAASRGFVDFLLHSKHAQDLLAWTKLTGIPDETFFATVNNMHQFGVPGSYTGSLKSKHHIMLNRFKIWDQSNRTCSGQFVRHICHFGPAEVATLARSRHLIANKFTYHTQPLAYDCTEQWYFHRVRREQMTGVADVDTRPYSRLELVKYAYRNKNSAWG